MQDKYVVGLETYIVGGYVRDELLGLPAGDRDWVVVGASPEVMMERGFIPVGEDFPVFLHPVSHEEYALARTERKSGKGYKGFTFYTGTDVSLEQDLARRDLTINAIAKDVNDLIIDPLNGLTDLDSKVLRHIGNAFTEDPVRLLRLARFAARFNDFRIAAETENLCKQLVASGELDALVPERIWQEFAKGLMTENPAIMLNFLAKVGALAKVAPNLIWHDRYADLLNHAAQGEFSLAQRYALMCFWSPNKVQLKSPTVCKQMADLLPKIVNQLNIFKNDVSVGKLAAGSAIENYDSCLQVFKLTDAFRKPDRFLDLLNVALLLIDVGKFSLWQKKLKTLLSINTAEIAKNAAGDVNKIKNDINVARLQSLADIYINN